MTGDADRTIRDLPRPGDTIRMDPVAVKRCPECDLRFGVDAAFCPFDGVALRTATWDKSGDPLTGKRIDGRYEVLEPLGQGGMGTVYRVRHVTLDRLFAMKVLRRDLADDQELARRFVVEAKATAAVKHPGVVAINDFGELEDGTPYFVMELLVGETLSTRIRARGPLTPEDAIKVGRKLCDALEASHAAGVVHRDLKPDNVFLVGRSLGRSAEEEVRIVDFGAARVVGASRLTRPGVVFGTPYYMSPEQVSGQVVDARADVYSLGVLLYEMVTGHLPFEADTYMGVLTKHMFQRPAKPSERVSSGVQLGPLEDVILKSLEKDPAARFQTMAEVSWALANARRPSAVARAAAAEPHRMPVALGGMSKTERLQQALDKQLAEEAKRRRALVVIATMAMAGTMLLGVGGLWLAHVRGARAEERVEKVEKALGGARTAPAPPPALEAPRPDTAAPSTAPPTAPTPEAVASARAEGAEAPPSSTAGRAPRTPTTGRVPAAPAGPAAAQAGGSAAGSRHPTSAEDFEDPWKR